MKYTKTIRASKRVSPATRPVSASRAALRRKAVKADDEIADLPADAPDEAPATDADVSVDAEASELLFEAEDVAELISEVTESPVDVTVDKDQVVFTIGEDEYTVTPEGDEEVVEDSRKLRRSARSVRAGRAMRRPMARRPESRVAASRRASVARRVAASRKAPATRRVAASRRVSAARRTQK